MTTEPLPAIEPVTDEEFHDFLLALKTDRIFTWSELAMLRNAIEQDRRRVAERRVGRQSDYNPTSPSHEAANAELARIASVIDDAREIERLRAENTTLRSLVAMQTTPCVYCGLTEMAKCASGFPGCARADDLICGEEEAFKAVVSERNTLRAEVAALKAACAHRLEALRGANHRIIYGEWASDYSHNLFAAALSTDAGKGWIDATGAVEVPVLPFYTEHGGVVQAVDYHAPAAWAGSSVLIVRKP